MTVKAKREMLIAILLVACFLLSAAIMLFAENAIGIPSYYNGEMANIKVEITEICSSNSSIIATDNGDTPDYIELYNAGETFNLADFGLANDSGNSIAYTFGDIEFKAGSYLVVYLDGSTVPFKLNSAGGEYVALVSWDGTVIAKATTVKTQSNQVMLLEKGEYTVSDKASPGYPNTDEGVNQFLQGDKDGEMELIINEVLTANSSVLPDFQGDYCDVIEIKNTTSAIISTKGYFISDSVTQRMRYSLPDRSIGPGEVLLIFASGKDVIADNGEIHTDFKLSAGEAAVLTAGSAYTALDIEACETNCSQAFNGSEYVKTYATPGFENSEAGLLALQESRIYADSPLVINELLLSSDEAPYMGKLRDVIELCNTSSNEISTSGWFISDSEDDPYKFALPEMTLAPNQCVILYADKSGESNSTGFGLSSGESVYLTAPDFRRTEFVPCDSAGTGYSRTRVIDNGKAVYVNGKISLGFANDEGGIMAYNDLIRPAEVEISEVVALNNEYLPGPYETYHDFLELHNRTDKDIDLTGWYLSDDSQEPMKGSLDGVIIPANGYLVVILSADANPPRGYPTVGFSVSSGGETVCLSKGESIVDLAIIPSLGVNTAFGRPNGESGFAILEKPTPEAENSSAAKEKAATPTASLPQGVYDEKQITVELQGEGNIYYTLDCEIPTSGSTLYTQPFVLDSTTVIRCVSVVQGKQASEVLNLTYIVNEPDTLETVSVVTEAGNLFDYYHGIYATGPNASAAFPYNGANYYNPWEREANISFFAHDGSGFSENCGVQIFGGLSRALEKKSLSFHFRSAYGCSQLNYRLFNDSDLEGYETFILRNTGQDWKLSTMRDAMMTKLASDYLDLDVQNCRPVVVYINGEYWGIYFIREKLNENYVAGHYNVSPDVVNVTGANGRNNDEYQALLSYAKNNDLSVPENYEHIKTLMDVENYATYIVTEIIVGNADNGNIKFFTYEGGKWRWMLYDVDHGFRQASHDTVTGHLNPAGTGASDMFSTALINSLLKNDDFYKMFLEEMAYQINNVWTPEIINGYIDTFEGYIKDDIQRDCTRWSHSYDAWVNAVESLRYFAQNREGYLVDYVQSYFHLSDSQMQSYGFDI